MENSPPVPEWQTQFTNDGHGGTIPVRRFTRETGQVQLPIIVREDEDAIVSVEWVDHLSGDAGMNFAEAEARVLARLGIAQPSQAQGLDGEWIYETTLDAHGQREPVGRRHASTGEIQTPSMVYHDEGGYITGVDWPTPGAPGAMQAGSAHTNRMEYGQESIDWAAAQQSVGPLPGPTVTGRGHSNIIDVSNLSTDEKIRVQTMVDLADGRALAEHAPFLARYGWPDKVKVRWTWNPWVKRLGNRFVAARAHMEEARKHDSDGALHGLCAALAMAAWTIALIVAVHY